MWPAMPIPPSFASWLPAPSSIRCSSARPPSVIRAPAVLAPEVHYPSYGNALYVFALPEKK
jgi:hypothetical protein